MWRTSLNEMKVKKFKEGMDKYKLDPTKVLIHASYLINLASPKEDVWEKSKVLLKSELEISHELNLKYVNVHPGSRLDSPAEVALERVGRAIYEILKDSPKDVMLVLENVSPKGGNIGYNFHQLKTIADISGCNVKFTYDTCHGFDGGYDIRTHDGMKELLSEIDDTIGMDKLIMCHLNDSKYPLGFHKDRHERIGKGYIGKDGFTNFFSYDEIRCIPMILETPGGEIEHEEDILTVKKILSFLGLE